VHRKKKQQQQQQQQQQQLNSTVFIRFFFHRHQATGIALDERLGLCEPQRFLSHRTLHELLSESEKWGWVQTLVPSEPQNSWDLWMFIPL